jgi:hypothetical protein
LGPANRPRAGVAAVVERELAALAPVLLIELELGD